MNDSNRLRKTNQIDYKEKENLKWLDETEFFIYRRSEKTSVLLEK